MESYLHLSSKGDHKAGFFYLFLGIFFFNVIILFTECKHQLRNLGVHCVWNGARQRPGATSEETLSPSFALNESKTAAEGNGFQKPSRHRVVYAFCRGGPASDAALSVLFPREKGQKASAAPVLLHNCIIC